VDPAFRASDAARPAASDHRRALQQLLADITAGRVDIVVGYKIDRLTRRDRLARSTFDLFAIVKGIVDAGGQFRSLAEPWADTSTSTGRLMLAVLGGLADVERDLIRTRTAEGRSRAKAGGQHMGRPSSRQNRCPRTSSAGARGQSNASRRRASSAPDRRARCTARSLGGCRVYFSGLSPLQC
jgi:DNA invertase Pin-like site-specific DNA recombinase